MCDTIVKQKVIKKNSGKVKSMDVVAKTIVLPAKVNKKAKVTLPKGLTSKVARKVFTFLSGTSKDKSGYLEVGFDFDNQNQIIEFRSGKFLKVFELNKAQQKLWSNLLKEASY